MSKVMLIEASQEEQSRVAIVEDGILESLEIESISRTLKGNIYKAVVQNVATALGAAFVNYGDERAGFLPLDEVNFKVLPPRGVGEAGRRGKISDHLQPGTEVLVQVVRDAFNTKPPTLSTFYSLPGRYLVLTPKSDGQGISRKIEDAAERDHLKKIVEELDPPEGFGVIVRTAGMGQTKTELQRDLKYLLRLWEAIESAARSHRAPSLIYQERDVVLRTIRDHFSADIEEVLIDSAEVHQKASRFVQSVMPTKEKVFKLYTGDKPLFSKFNLEDQIESIFRREVNLPSGGAIVIDETEALTAVDVNSARSAREANIEDLAFKTNLEAAEEVARQLRLRDLGGLVVIDFIDMYQAKNSRAVEKKMKDAMKRDRAKYDIGRISKFGLMEISRQRIKATKASATYMPCARCEGMGVVKTVESASLVALRRIQARVVKGDLDALKATLPEDVAVYLLNNKRDDLLSLERRYDLQITIIPHATMTPNRGEFDTTARETPRENGPSRRALVSDEEAARALADGARPDTAMPVVLAIPESDDHSLDSPDSTLGAVLTVIEAPEIEETPALELHLGPVAPIPAQAAAPAETLTPWEELIRGSIDEQPDEDLRTPRPAGAQADTMFLAGPDAGDAFAPGDESGREDEADAAGGEVPAVAADTTGNGDGAKRRRRRGRRGGRRGDAARVAGEPGAPEAAVPALTAMDGGEGESDAEVDSTGSSAAIDEGNGVAGTAGGPGETGQKRRRRRHRSRRHSGEETAAPGAGAGPADYGRSQPRATLFESSVPQSAAPATVAPSRAPAGAIPAGNAGDEIEDIPGGWWQKLTGGSRRGGRGPGTS